MENNFYIKETKAGIVVCGELCPEPSLAAAKAVKYIKGGNVVSVNVPQGALSFDEVSSLVDAFVAGSPEIVLYTFIEQLAWAAMWSV